MKVVLLLVCLAGLALANTWNGEYTDSEASGGYGGSFYVCADDDEMYGFYSWTGLAVGKVDEERRTWTGKFYEGGFGDCLFGEFRLTLDADNHGFGGYYTCEYNDEKFPWTATRIHYDKPDVVQCGKLSKTEPISGFYEIAGYLAYDICTVNGKLATSYYDVSQYYEVAEPAVGTEKGLEWESGRIGTGVWCETDGECGSTLWFRDRYNRLVNSWFDEDGINGIDVFPSRAATTTERKCHANDDIFEEGAFPFQVVESPYALSPALSSENNAATTSGAAALSSAFLLVIAVLLLIQ